MGQNQRSSDIQKHPLSYGQKALWLLYRLSPERAAYNVNFAWQIQEGLNINTLKKSLKELIIRHPSLRTTYSTNKEGEPLQYIHPHMDLQFEEIDAVGWSERTVQEILKSKIHRPFNLEIGPVSRFSILKRSGEVHVFLMTIHHIAIDMWSIMILMDELSQIYTAFSQSPNFIRNELELPKIDLQYTDFVDWQKKMLESSKGEKHRKFWQKQLSGTVPVLSLPIDTPRLSIIRYRGDLHTFKIPSQLASRAEALAGKEGVTLPTLYMAIFFILLHRYTDQKNILLGTPTAGRSLKYKKTIGYFASQTVIRCNFSHKLSFQKILKQLHHTILTTLFHKDYPFPLIVEQLQPERELSHSPLTQVSFIWNEPNLLSDRHSSLITMNKEKEEVWQIGDLQWARIELLSLLHNFDLNLTVNKINEELYISIEYNSDLFKKETILRMSNHYFQLLENILAFEGLPISQIPMLTKLEQKKILLDWNQSHLEFPFEKCIHHWFEHQTKQSPNAISVISGGEEFTYYELNTKANQLAHYLQKKGVKSESLVGIFIDRSFNMIVSLMAILKAGGAYVALDPKFPQERLNAILTDSQLSIVLTNSTLKKQLPSYIHTIILDEENAIFSNERITNPINNIHLNNLCYIIYTSGSTGKPKGVAIEHHSVSNLINWAGKEFSQEELSGVLAAISLSFDVSVFEIFAPLAHGGTLILVENALHLPTTPAANKIRMTASIPSSIKEWIRLNSLPSSMVTIGTGGEPLDKSLVQNLHQLKHIKRILNFYGPTETTVIITCNPNPMKEKDRPSIGGPLPNTELYVLDQYWQPVPISVPGELYIGGRGLARGYWNRPDLTSEKFIPNPFNTSQSSRLYKTGDLVRYLPNGTIEFLGRLDHQIKIRGFRIELGDIETTLRKHPSIQEAVVLDHQDTNQNKLLIGYVVLKEGVIINPLTLRKFTQKHLPEYMVPTEIIILDKIPLTANGKINRNALPTNETKSNSISQTQPQHNLEKIITSIWKDILSLDQIGIHDNFFDLGGHSLLLAQVYTRLPEILKSTLTIVDLFKYPTIYKLAKHLGADQQPDSFSEKKSNDKHLQQTKKCIQEVPGLKIAIVGMAGRFPGAQNVEQFWQNIVNGTESISHFSDTDMENSPISVHIWKQPNYVKSTGTLKDVELFDAAFFNFSPKEAQIMDPQHRLFLECAWEVLENASLDPERFKGAIGVYGGTGPNSYYINHLSLRHDLIQSMGSHLVHMGNDKDFLCSRVSYKLGLEGPGVAVQSACSTSLVAVHLACKGLLSGECDVALAGGVSLGELQKGYIFQEGMILSPTGQCCPFDAKAQGTVPGQGVGLIALRRLEESIEAGDHIYAVIIGTAINNDGANRVGYSAPGIEGQSHVIQSAQVMAGISPETIEYIEAHGTGTVVGDPIEIKALIQAFQKTNKKQFCAIGSVKSNIGHLDAAAGIAGLIKSVLALKNKILPPSINYQISNPNIDFENSPFYVNTEAKKWKTAYSKRRAGISSFGLGGTNAHVILEEAPPLVQSEVGRPHELLILSAKSNKALEKMTQNLADYIDKNSNLSLSEIAYTLHLGRQAFPYRTMLVCKNTSDALEHFQTKPSKKVFSDLSLENPPPIIFMFPGQSAQYLNMGRYLYQIEETFRNAVDRCHHLLHKKLPNIFLNFKEQDLKNFEEWSQETHFTQVNIFIIEYALAKLLKEWGITPTWMIGHSLGEYMAAYMAGVFTLEDALILVALRGQLINNQVNEGQMLSVYKGDNSISSLTNYVSSHGELSLAAINTPSHYVFSGPSKAVQELQHYCNEQQIESRILNTSHAFHSFMLDPILDNFRQILENINFNRPKIPFISNVTGTWISDQEAKSPEYWVKHLRNTVHFSEGMTKLFQKHENSIFLEIGPNNILCSLAKQHSENSMVHTILPTMRHPREETNDSAVLLTTLGKLWLKGVEINWQQFHSSTRRSRCPLPLYPFEKKRYWIPPISLTSKITNEKEDLEKELSVKTSDRPSIKSTSPKTSIEQAIAQIWEDFLGIKTIGIDDSFFDLGGDSMIAIGILNQLNKEFDLSISSHTLLTKPTISDLAKTVESLITQPSHSFSVQIEPLIIEMQSGEANLPKLFLIHPGGGHIYFYHDLVTNLNIKNSIYGIQSQGLDGQLPILDTVEAMAGRYIDEMLSFYAADSYLLGGASFGGIIAYEMANQLHQKQIEVPLLTMVDSPGPKHMPKVSQESAAILLNFFGEIPLSLDQLQMLDIEGQVAYVIQQAEKFNFTNKLPPNFGPTFLKVVSTNHKAMFSYKPSPYQGKVLFFKHSEAMVEYDDTPEQAWAPLVEQFQVISTPGSHLTMNLEPHVKSLAQCLRQKITKLNA